MKKYDVLFAFEHGYNWREIEANTGKEALTIALGMVDVDEDDIAAGADNYYGVGDLQIITVEADKEYIAHNLTNYQIESEAHNLLEALEQYEIAYQSWNDREEGADDNLHHAAEQARKAIAKAKVQTC